MENFFISFNAVAPLASYIAIGIIIKKLKIVDDDFLKQINGVFTSLYNQDQELIYGENPIAVVSQSVEFKNSVIQTDNADHTKYYIFTIIF